jgi:hypothetical protein
MIKVDIKKSQRQIFGGVVNQVMRELSCRDSRMMAYW